MEDDRRPPSIPDQPCWGRSCPGPCPADDCFIGRRMRGRGDMIWNEEIQGPEPPMSDHVVAGLLEWMDNR